jgi:hypothetical protein
MRLTNWVAAPDPNQNPMATLDNVFLFNTVLTGGEIGNLYNYNDIVPEPVTAITMLLLAAPLVLRRKRR